MPVTNQHGNTFQQKPRTQKIEEADKTGYNSECLKGYMLMSGYKASSTGLAEVLGVSQPTAYRKIRSGEFTRLQILRVKETLHLTPEQLCDTFFNDKPNYGKEWTNHRKKANKKGE